MARASHLTDMAARRSSWPWRGLRLVLALLAATGLQLGAVRAALGLGCARAPHHTAVVGAPDGVRAPGPAPASLPRHVPGVERCAAVVAVLPAPAEVPRAALLPRGTAPFGAPGGPSAGQPPPPLFHPPRLI